jgi:hypothetical protein
MATDTTATFAAHNTLTSTTVDTVTLQGHFSAVEIANREFDAAAGVAGADLWVTLGWKGITGNANSDTVPATPTAALNDAYWVPAGTTLVINVPNHAQVQPIVKILGNGNKYSVTGLQSRDNGRANVLPALVVPAS